jgi:sarcosine oxidase subunit beta
MGSDRPSRFEVAIIGAGLVGLFTALRLHKQGIRRVAVFDRGRAGGLASPRAGGLIRRHYNHPLLVEMAQLGKEQYSRLGKECGRDIGYKIRGYLLVVRSAQLDLIESSLKMQQELGVDTGLLSSARLQAEFEEFKDLGQDSLLVHERDSAFADPPATSRGVVELVRSKGICLIEDSPVVEVVVSNGKVAGVETAERTYECGVVVNAAGAWSAGIAAGVGIDLPVQVRRLLQIVNVRAAANESVRTLSHEVADLYARHHHSGGMLIGGRHYFEEPMEPEDVPLIPVLSKARQLVSSFRSMATFSVGQIIDGWAGIDGDTPDFQPVLGPTPGIDGLYVATGFSGHGFKLAPIAGQLIAEHIRFGEYKTLDASPLEMTRFAKGELFELGHKQMGA